MKNIAERLGTGKLKQNAPFDKKHWQIFKPIYFAAIIDKFLSAVSATYIHK